MTVSILGMRYNVSYETSEQMKGELGMCTPWKLDIRINKEAPDPQKEETLLHEALPEIPGAGFPARRGTDLTKRRAWENMGPWNR